MQYVRRRRYATLFAIAGMVSLSGTGCDEAGRVADDVSSSVSEAIDPTPATPATTETPATSPPVQPVGPPQKPPAEIFAEFQQLPPEQVTDSSLSQVAASPEAASMVTEVASTSPAFTGQGILLLAGLRNLTSVSIGNPAIQPAQLASLADIKSAVQIRIPASLADDNVVAALATLPDLEGIDLTATRITPAAADSLSRMQKLRELVLRGTQSDDSAVAAVAGLPLRSLDLANTSVTNTSLPLLMKIATLEELDLSFTQVTGDAFKGFSRMGIKKLNVSETEFGIEGFAAIKGMQQLEDLDVHSSGLVEHVRVDVFTTFPELKILNAGGNAITDAGMDRFFKGHRSLQVLKLQGNSMITDNGLAALVGVKTLKSLEVQQTRCTAVGARALKERLPECEIFTADGRF